MNRVSGRGSNRAPNHPVALVAIVLAFQAIAATFFVADAIGDLTSAPWNAHLLVELLVSLALVAGVVTGAWLTRYMLITARERERLLAQAQGALADQMELRFRDWRLTAAEAEVALFAIKGCDTEEIARLRGAAQGTVRAQLSRVYAKAGVASQAELVSVFIDELLDLPPVSAPASAAK